MNKLKEQFELYPYDPIVNFRLAMHYVDQRNYQEAEVYCRRAVDFDASYNPKLSYALSHILLAQGKYEEGFLHYESRPCLPATQQRNFYLESKGMAPWRGECLTGKSIVLVTDQGIGDIIQYARFVSSIVDKLPNRVLLWLPEIVTPIMKFDGAEVSTTCFIEPFEFQYYCSFDSLPYYLHVTVDTIPKPYQLDVIKKDWKLSGFNVGLAWQGNPSHPKDSLRSIPLEMFQPLFEISDVNFISLQKNCKNLMGFPLINHIESCETLMDTASLIDHLDLVISVDSAVAHLSGTMNKKIWMLNRYESEWRWMIDREDSPWYPSMRIFTQPKLHDWNSVIQRIKTNLENP